MINSIKAISQFLDSITELTGFFPIWKNACGGGDERMSRRHILHCNPYCEKVKGKHIKKCSNNVLLVKSESEKRKAPFLHECHAGVSELIVPIFHNDNYDGAIFLGVAKGSEMRSPYKEAQKEFASLPLCDLAKLKSIENLLRVLSCCISEHRFSLLKEIELDKIKNSKIQKALKFIDENYSSKISASETARHCSLSASRFVHLFKEQAGQTFSECLIEMRILKAKKMLIETNLKIFDIAEAVGFSEQSYFGAAFKKKTGESPNKFRRARQKIIEP